MYVIKETAEREFFAPEQIVKHIEQIDWCT